MARPIKETPILYGEDARRFEARMKEKRRISPEERAEMEAAYIIFLDMLKRGEEHQKRLREERKRLKEQQNATESQQ